MKETMKCSECGGVAKKVGDIEFTIEQENKSILITNLTGYRCSQCGTEYHSADTVEKVQRILKAIKRKKPTIQFTRKLTSSGKRWVLGIPSEIMGALELKGGEDVKIYLAGRKIIAEFLELS